jgi:hypothetical protein
MIFTYRSSSITDVTMETTWYYKTPMSGCSEAKDSNGISSCARDMSRTTLGYTVEIDVAFRPPEGMVVNAITRFTPPFV